MKPRLAALKEGALGVVSAPWYIEEQLRREEAGMRARIGTAAAQMICLAVGLCAAPATAQTQQPQQSDVQALQKKLPTLPKADPDAAALVTEAAQRMTLEAPGATPFRLLAHMLARDLAHPPTEGTFELIWASPEEWREELTLPDFHQVRVFHKDTLWTKRNVPYLPFAADRVIHLMRHREPFAAYLDRLPLAPIEQRKTRTGMERCVGLQVGTSADWERCYAGGTPDLLRFRANDGVVGLDFADYVAFGAKRVARKMVIVERGVPIVEAHIEELREWNAEDATRAAAFSPPEGATPRRWCANPTPASRLAVTAFVPGRIARTRPAVVYGVIGTDGAWREFRVLESGDTPEAQDEIEGLRNAHWTPATCNGSPVETEGTFSVSPYFR